MDWVDIIKEEEDKKNNSCDKQDDDYIELPEPEIFDLNADGSLQKRITYEYDENDPNIIYRVERIYQIQKIEQKISESAINRKKNWQKFGQVANIPKGQTERGVTSKRPTEVPFLWTGMEAKKPKSIHDQLIKPVSSLPFSSKFLSKQPREVSKMDDNASTSNSSLSGKSDSGPVEIKISNLPQNVERDDIKRLINAFYIHYLKVDLPWPRNKIRMIPSWHTLEKWNKDPIYYKKKLEDYERMAIIEFPNGENAKEAIKKLNGYRYDYCILSVEKAQPRNNNGYNGYNNNYNNGYSKRRW